MAGASYPSRPKSPLATWPLDAPAKPASTEPHKRNSSTISTGDIWHATCSYPSHPMRRSLLILFLAACGPESGDLSWPSQHHAAPASDPRGHLEKPPAQSDAPPVNPDPA